MRGVEIGDRIRTLLGGGVEHEGAGITCERVIPRPARDGVIAVAAHDGVIAFAGINLVGGEQALQKALVKLKERGRTVLIVAHQPSTLRTADKMLVLKEGRVAAFGERNKALQALMRQPQPRRVVSIQGQGGKAFPPRLEVAAER